MHVSLCLDVLGFDYINKFCMLYIVIFNFGLSENYTKFEKNPHGLDVYQVNVQTKFCVHLRKSEL